MTNRAVLLANLGSPDSPTETDVRSYLNQFLMDPYVIQLPWILRRLIVSAFVLPKRPKASAAAYSSVWMDQGSPLIVLSRILHEALSQSLDMPVALAMRYGQPSIESQLLALAEQTDISEVLYIPLYPHYADSTVTTSIVEAQRVIRQHRLNFKFNVLPPFYDHPDYIAALVARAKPVIERTVNDYGSLDSGKTHIVFSYHGLPESHLVSADPSPGHCLQQANCCETPSPAHATCYRHQVLRTTQCFAELAGLEKSHYSVAYQSRLGRAKWLEPNTEDNLQQLAEKGVKHVLVMCPAFVTDCLETLEEIQIRGQEVFKEAGGDTLELIPCLNAHPDWVRVLAGWCRSTPTAG